MWARFRGYVVIDEIEDENGGDDGGAISIDARSIEDGANREVIEGRRLFDRRGGNGISGGSKSVRAYGGCDNSYDQEDDADGEIDTRKDARQGAPAASRWVVTAARLSSLWTNDKA
ncbi:hypothetical protein ml_95 [Mollivirus sibericum]|uniref:hypothetical protein n=1 Tax=Mollivirus sibericum TaxID=1678078 RepID=UPI0006B2E31E|nr:hypothetical protein ml_95 [Mollivirus sibericum]ALD61897.1 hypothetical protein ml_95 [Mollivirus sibericum]